MYELVIIALILLVLIYYVSRTEQAAAKPSKHERFIGDPNQFSPYGNESLADTDNIGTQHDLASRVMLEPTTDPALNKYDNAATVAEVLADLGPTEFIPNQTEYGETSFQLGEPGYRSPYYLPQTTTNADELLARRQQHIGGLFKRAIDGNVRTTKNMFVKYFAAELDECDHRDWWGDQTDDLETNFRTY